MYFFKLFCFLPTYMFEFNKWSLNLNFKVTTIYFSQNAEKIKIK